MNIFEALREDHQKQRTLLDILIKTEGASEGREEIFEKVKKELEHHAIAEERHFYVPLMEHDLTQEKSRHSVAEHHDIDECIKKMEETEQSSPAWLSYAKKLHELVNHHLDEEEHEVFQMAGKALTETQKGSLAGDYRGEMERLAAEES